MGTEIIRFNTGCKDVEMHTSPNSFRPNKVSEAFLKTLPQTLEGMMVYDIGSGGGIIAIGEAHRGAKEVHAVEPASANYNNLIKNVSMQRLDGVIIPHLGEYFYPLRDIEKADVITADVSGIPETFGRALGWYPQGINTGGSQGYEITCELLKRAPDHIKKNGVLFFPTANDLLDYNKILDIAKAGFNRVENALCSKQELEIWKSSEEAKTNPWRSPEYVWFQLREQDIQKLQEAYNYKIPDTINIQEFIGPRNKTLKFWRGQIYKASEPKFS
jgi:hypothetical protein